VCISISFQILLPVVPVMAERRGPHGIAGAATAALFVGAVTGELATPWLLTRFHSKRLLIAAQLLTALPSLVFVLRDPPTWAMLAGAYGRGLAMGVAIVVSVTLLSELTPPERRGSSIGYYGFALSAPGVFIPSAGVFLLANGRSDIDGLIAFAVGVAGAFIAIRIPERPSHALQHPANMLATLRRPGMLAVFVGFVLVSCTFGGVFTYAPVALPLQGLGSAAAFLLAVGSTRALSRWVAGYIGDRVPARALLLGALPIALVSLVTLALTSAALWVLIAGALYGIGFGALHTASYLAMNERGTSSDSGAISALWNSAVDMGGTLGGSMIGVVAAQYGYAAAAWSMPLVAVLALPLFLLPAREAPRPLGEAEIFVR
jgi:predicted MFS family arabinose efflux permease